MPYQMPNGKWRAKRMINGQVKTKVFPAKREAIAWEVNQSIEAWSAPISTTPTVCLLDFANAYMDFARERFARTTMNCKRIAFRRLFSSIPPDTAPDDITPRMALDMLRKVLRDSGAPNANYARKDLSAAWEWGKRFYGLPRINPFHEVEKFPVDEKPRYVPPESDFWKVYDMADDNDKVLLLFLLHTGARCGEAFRLRWEDIDLQEQKVRLGTRKRAGGGMEYDWIPLTSELQAALAEHKSRTKSLYVFNSQVTGQHFVRRGTFMKALCATAGVKHFGYHAIRHLSATILAYAGLDIPTVQAVLRHKNPNTTAHYIKSLGIQPDKLDSVFSKRRASKVVPFKARAVGT